MIEAFPSRTEDDLGQLTSGAGEITYDLGDVVLAEGAEPEGIYVVREGVVEVQRGREGSTIQVNSIGPGGVFGEMSFLDRGSASTTVVAAAEATIDRIPRAHVQGLLDGDDGFGRRFDHSLAITLSKRLRRATDLLVPVLLWE